MEKRKKITLTILSIIYSTFIIIGNSFIKYDSTLNNSILEKEFITRVSPKYISKTFRVLVNKVPSISFDVYFS